MAQPRVVIIAGPNGAGKTTTSRRVLQGALSVNEFVNADAIANGISAFRPEAAAMEAGRIMLLRLRELAAKGADFAFETTLASRHFASWIRDLHRDKGYELHLVFFWLPSPELAIQRVARRVASGGHFVPDDTVRRRYHGGLRNFFELYQPSAKRWRVYDSSGDNPRLIALGSGAAARLIPDTAIWNRLRQEYGDEQ